MLEEDMDMTEVVTYISLTAFKYKLFCSSCLLEIKGVCFICYVGRGIGFLSLKHYRLSTLKNIMV